SPRRSATPTSSSATRPPRSRGDEQRLSNCDPGSELLDEEKAVRGVARLVGIGVAELAQERAELPHLALRHLDAHQHAPVVGAVVAVVKQADVPVAPQLAQEL